MIRRPGPVGLRERGPNEFQGLRPRNSLRLARRPRVPRADRPGRGALFHAPLFSERCDVAEGLLALAGLGLGVRSG